MVTNDKPLAISIPESTLQQLRAIAPTVGVDPKHPLQVLVKALRLLEFARNGNVTVSTPHTDYKINLKKL